MLEEGTTIEVAPAITISSEERARLIDAKIFQYLFVNPHESAASPNSLGYLVLGLMTLCSHSDEPNAKVFWNESGGVFFASIKALRSIAQGEEITVFYTNINEYPNRQQFIDRKSTRLNSSHT